eukprot:TRINITY_DN2636_c0_g1_i2.p1 TRINITY_DN2636_c0_g1~~TRINITY_DN2636_c0_g1_i2.p1  ORF type:complete len:537 (+),score=104.00 TRINITY_DN2636_c0_g1_i2:260-1870(+)
MQKFVGAESAKACVEDGFSTEDSDNESPVTSSDLCFQSESKAEDSKGSFPKVRQKGSERQVWRELYAADSSTMPKTSPNHSKPKVGKAGARRGCLAASGGVNRTCLEADAGVNCGEHTDRNRQHQSELDEAAAGLCCLSVSSQSPPVRGRETGYHKPGGDPRGRLPADRSVSRPKISRDVDLSPQAAGSVENDSSKRKVSTRRQSTPVAVPTLSRSKSEGNEDVAGSAPSMADGDNRTKGGSRPYASDDHGVSCGDVEVVITQSTGTDKKAVATSERSPSAEDVSVDEEPAAGGTTDTKQTGNDGTAWSSSDGASTSHSGRSSGSSSSSYAGSGSEEDNDEHHDPEDDWETAADALYTHSMYRNNGEGKGKVFKGDALHHGAKDTLDKKTNGFSSLELQHGGVLKPEYKYKTNGFGGRMRGNGGRAWRPDDVSRPPTLPRLTKQHSYPMQSAQGVWGPVHGNMWGPPATPSYCPICTEELDMTDSSFVPCSCGFRLCLFCHHRIASDDGRCPGCRKAYNSDVAMKLSRASSMWLRA